MAVPPASQLASLPGCAALDAEALEAARHHAGPVHRAGPWVRGEPMPPVPSFR